VTVPRLAAVVAALEQQYPPDAADSWDAVGLTLGDPDQSVQRVLFAVDPTAEVAAEAISSRSDLLVTHHPLFLRPVHGFAQSTAKGRLATDLVRAGVALFTAHTNADVAEHGVNDALADALGLSHLEPLIAKPVAQDKVVTFVPVDAVERVAAAMADIGAGTIGDYTRCTWSVVGDGSFLPGPGATPVVGEVGREERTAEARLEMLTPRGLRADVVTALVAAHPYEEVAYDIYELVGQPGSQGHGRVGQLEQPMSLASFAAHVAQSLPTTPAGVRWAGEAEQTVIRVAVIGGAGDSMFDAALASGADVLVTADLRHHPVSELRGRAALAVVDPGHFASEWPWLPVAALHLVSAMAGHGWDVEARVSTLVTDPWSGLVQG
jgi:dinuclear metal center YbgI/SA1388 family protein